MTVRVLKLQHHVGSMHPRNGGLPSWGAPKVAACVPSGSRRSVSVFSEDSSHYRLQPQRHHAAQVSGLLKRKALHEVRARLDGSDCLCLATMSLDGQQISIHRVYTSETPPTDWPLCERGHLLRLQLSMDLGAQRMTFYVLRDRAKSKGHAAGPKDGGGGPTSSERSIIREACQVWPLIAAMWLGWPVV
jgi:hypothetical protein